MPSAKRGVASAAGQKGGETPAAPSHKKFKFSEISCVRCGLACLSDFSNFEVKRDSREKIVEVSQGCAVCMTFSSVKGMSLTDMVAAESKDKQSKAKHKEQQE